MLAKEVELKAQDMRCDCVIVIVGNDDSSMKLNFVLLIDRCQCSPKLIIS